MPTLLVLKNPKKWEKAVREGLALIKREPVELLVTGKAVTRCIRCEPELFRYLHQFVLDGGKALVCLSSLKKHGIPESRPPEVFDRIVDGATLIAERQTLDFRIREY